MATRRPHPATGARPRSFLYRLLVTTVLVIVILAVGELTLRAYAYYFRHPYQVFDPRLRMIRLVHNYERRDHGRLIRINSLGYRGAEFTPEKRPGVFRIVALGDSVTFGLAGEDCHYPAVLQARFDAAMPHRVEVINAGVEGYDSQDVLRLLDDDVMRYAPDLVTVMVGWNDLLKRDPARPAASPAEARLAYALYDVYLIKFWRSVIYRYARHALLRPGHDLPPAEAAALRTYVPEVYKEHLEQIIQRARRGGSRVVLLTLYSPLRPDMSDAEASKLYFPYYTYNLKKFWLLYQRYNATIRAVGRAYGVPVVESSTVLAGRDRLFMDTVHFECAGHHIFGDYLYRELAPYVGAGPVTTAARRGERR